MRFLLASTPAIPFLQLLVGVSLTHSLRIKPRHEALHSHNRHPRTDRPNDTFTPHDGPIRWAVLGDSFSAAPGAGDYLSPTGSYAPCYVTKGSYAHKLSQDFPWRRTNLLSNMQCTGARMMQVVTDQVPLIPTDKENRLDFVVLTVGASDISYYDIMRICLVGLRVSDVENCEGWLEWAGRKIESDGFRGDLWKLYDAVFERLDLGSPEQYYQVYHLPYPRLLEWADTEPNTCHDKGFTDDCSWTQPVTAPRLTQDLRHQVMDVFNKLNLKIASIAQEYIQDKQGNGTGQPQPGWAKNRLFVEKEIPGFAGHEVCYRGLNTLDDPKIYSQPWCSKGKDDLVKDTLSLDQFMLDPDACGSNSRHRNDEAYKYACLMSKVKQIKATQSNNSTLYNKTTVQFPPDARFVTPEDWIKVLHPRSNGQDAYKNFLANQLLTNRPATGSPSLAVNPRSDAGCPAPFDTDQVGSTERVCPILEKRQPTMALSIVAELLSNKKDVNWMFFATDYGHRVDCRTDPAYKEKRKWNTNYPYFYPGGTFNLELFGQYCQYKNDGTNLGRLFCGSLSIDCQQDPAQFWILQDQTPWDCQANYNCPGSLRQPVITCPY